MQPAPTGASGALASPSLGPIDRQREWPAGRGDAGHLQASPITPDASRVLRNTYALLSLTLLFSAGVAATSVALALPAPGIMLTLAGYFGFLFAVFKLKRIYARHSAEAAARLAALAVLADGRFGSK